MRVLIEISVTMNTCNSPRQGRMLWPPFPRGISISASTAVQWQMPLSYCESWARCFILRDKRMVMRAWLGRLGNGLRCLFSLLLLWKQDKSQHSLFLTPAPSAAATPAPSTTLEGCGSAKNDSSPCRKGRQDETANVMFVWYVVWTQCVVENASTDPTRLLNNLDIHLNFLLMPFCWYDAFK